MALLVLFALPVAAQPDAQTSESTLSNRHRLEFRVGFWNADQPQVETTTNPTQVKTSVENLMGAFTYSYRVQEHFATQVTFSGLVVQSSSVEWTAGVADSTLVLSSALLGMRYYPASDTQMPLQLYLSFGVGPYIGVESVSQIGYWVNESTKVLGTFGGQVGGGLDLQLGRHFAAGINLGYNFMADFPAPLAGQWNYSGLEVSAGLSLLIGG